MLSTKGIWNGNRIEVNKVFLSQLPKEFELDLGVERIKVVNMENLGYLLLESFIMPSAKEIIVSKLHSDLRIGPILGIMVRGLNPNNVSQFKRYFEVNTLGLTYVFDEIQLSKNHINGYYYDQNWSYTRVPRPNFVFNRTYPSSPESKVKLAKSVFFNPVTRFSKSEAMRFLEQNGILIPESFSRNFQKVYSRFPLFYLKPNHGAFGQGIYVAQKRDTDYLVYSGRDNTADLYNKAELSNFLNKLEGKGYLLQRGIEPIKNHGDPVDFRLHVLADPNPRLVFIAARTSKWNFLYTSDPKKVMGTKRLLSPQDNSSLNAITKRLHYVLTKAYGLYVEFSLDVIKEANSGDFYIVDINGKSTRTHPKLFGKDLSAYYNAPIKLAEHLFYTN